MIFPLEVLQNVLMGIRPIARLAQRFHSTGLNADSQEARRVYEFYTRFSSVEGKDILEIGPGHTLEVLERAVCAGAKSCAAVDVIEYVPSARAEQALVAYRIYDGKKIPFGSDRFDLIWSYTVFEHLRYPGVTVEECFRILRGGGKLVCLIDLGDHSFYGTGSLDPLKQFDCLKYPEWLWRLMKWNRSSYVNRLRKSDWLRILTSAGFRILECQVSESTEIAQRISQFPYLRNLSFEDAVTSTLIVSATKP